jgi:hypothetical protein
VLLRGHHEKAGISDCGILVDARERSNDRTFATQRMFARSTTIIAKLPDGDNAMSY